jgi:pimeloyl-ACP methyl ester carboxylesterase
MSKKHLVFLHGFLENASMWNSILGRISKSNLQLHFPEIPGHGLRHQLPEAITIDAYADEVMSQLDIPNEEKFILVGHSMGGYIGANIAKRYGNRLHALCLFQSKAGDDDADKKTARDRAIHAAQENKALYVRTMINGLFHEKNKARLQDLIDQQINYATSLDVKAITSALTVMKNRPSEIESLLNRDFSLFYFLGENDPSIVLQSVLQEIENLPGAAYYIEPHIGHMAHFEAPQTAGDFIQRIVRTIV